MFVKKVLFVFARSASVSLEKVGKLRKAGLSLSSDFHPAVCSVIFVVYSELGSLQASKVRHTVRSA